VGSPGPTRFLAYRDGSFESNALAKHFPALCTR
jgi:hypothetical protein